MHGWPLGRQLPLLIICAVENLADALHRGFFFVIHQMGVAAAHFKGTVPEQFRNHGLTCA